jgi:hypothetical protein
MAVLIIVPRPVAAQESAAAAAYPAQVVPAFPDSAFDAKTAVNWTAMNRAYGPFSADQVKRLNRDRFLVVPQKAGMKLPWVSLYGPRFDEMLGVFDSMGGPNDPADRAPQHARFVGPDVVLHAFHKYFSERLKELERGRLAALVEAMLKGTYENALAMRAQAPETARAAWDLALAQMSVPLTLIETRGPKPDYMGEEPEGGDTLEAALRVSAGREGDLPEGLRPAVRAALAKVYSLGAGGGPDPAAGLRLVPAYNSDTVDWSQFTPRSHYAETSVTRAYFRASIWLGQLGWRRDDPAALGPLVAWAAALSGPGSEGFAEAATALSPSRTDTDVPQTPAEAWRAVMGITSFFAGFHEDPSLMEAAELVASSWAARNAGSIGSADSPDAAGDAPAQPAPAASVGPEAPGDAAFLAELAAPMASLAARAEGFEALRGRQYQGRGVIAVLPQRFTVPWLLASELTGEASRARGEMTDLPARFSGLYLAWTLGSEYAATLVAREIELGLAGERAAPDAARKALAAMYQKAGTLSGQLYQVPAQDWARSVGAAWFNALRPLTRRYGEGFPLYMRSGSYAAKQLETLIGSWTELKHDTVLYEKPNFAEGGEGGEDERRPKRLPKGFVEPNLEFWDAMIAASRAMEEGFALNGIFPDELGEYGRLGSFTGNLVRLRSIATRELAGVSVSDDDYEFVRTFELEGMAGESGGGFRDPEIHLSGLVVDVQTVASGNSGVVHEGLGPPSLMLVLVGNENENRVCVGMAYDHYEFFMSPVMRLTDSNWKAAVYRRMPFAAEFLKSRPIREFQSRPAKPSWYGPLAR